MDAAPLALIMNSKAVEYADSGRPDSPVVEPRTRRSGRIRRPHAVRTRTALAGALRRAADAVTPPAPGCDRTPHGAW
jgi:hypothetical protein